jgi:hypothetical protein
MHRCKFGGEQCGKRVREREREREREERRENASKARE